MTLLLCLNTYKRPLFIQFIIHTSAQFRITCHLIFSSEYN
nr:MAG TPA: hypothetical protein [Caudoviricetes sp.]